MAQPEQAGTPQHQASKQYFDAFDRIRLELGYPTERKPLLIGIDGRDGSGKSTLASWLAWQLEMPVIHLDLFVVPASDPLQWRIEDLKRVVDARLSSRRPVIVEGILLLEALCCIELQPNFLILVKNHNFDGSFGLAETIDAYFNRYNLKDRVNMCLSW